MSGKVITYKSVDEAKNQLNKMKTEIGNITTVLENEYAKLIVENKDNWQGLAASEVYSVLTSNARQYNRIQETAVEVIEQSLGTTSEQVQAQLDGRGKFESLSNL